MIPPILSYHHCNFKEKKNLRRVVATCPFTHIGERQMGRNVQNSSVWRLKTGRISHSGIVIGLLSVINKTGVGKSDKGLVPSTDLLKRKFLPSAAIFFFFLSFFFSSSSSSKAPDHPSPPPPQRALKGVNLSLMVTRSVPPVEKQESERVETSRRLSTTTLASVTLAVKLLPALTSAEK